MFRRTKGQIEELHPWRITSTLGGKFTLSSFKITNPIIFILKYFCSQGIKFLVKLNNWHDMLVYLGNKDTNKQKNEAYSCSSWLSRASMTFCFLRPAHDSILLRLAALIMGSTGSSFQPVQLIRSSKTLFPALFFKTLFPGFFPVLVKQSHFALLWRLSNCASAHFRFLGPKCFPSLAGKRWWPDKQHWMHALSRPAFCSLIWIFDQPCSSVLKLLRLHIWPMPLRRQNAIIYHCYAIPCIVVCQRPEAKKKFWGNKQKYFRALALSLIKPEPDFTK
jgi:hypothetical protein